MPLFLNHSAPEAAAVNIIESSFFEPLIGTSLNPNTRRWRHYLAYLCDFKEQCVLQKVMRLISFLLLIFLIKNWQKKTQTKIKEIIKIFQVLWRLFRMRL